MTNDQSIAVKKAIDKLQELIDKYNYTGSVVVHLQHGIVKMIEYNIKKHIKLNCDK